MNRRCISQTHSSGHGGWFAKQAALALTLALMMPHAAPARAAEWEKRFFHLAGACYHLSAPTDWGPIRGGGENRIAALFLENGHWGTLLISASPLEDMKASLEKAGVPLADWLLGGVIAGDEAAMFAVGQLAKAAGLKSATVESVGRRKALVYEAVQNGAIAAVFVCLEGELVITAQIRLEGAQDATRQRVLVGQVMEGFDPERTIARSFGKHRVSMPANWEFIGSDGSAVIAWQAGREGDRITAIACVVRLSKADQPGQLTGAEALTEPMRGMLEKMLTKLGEAGLTEDDGLVRLYDCSEPGFPFWVAILVQGDAALIGGVRYEGVRGGDGAREVVEQLVRGMDAMQGSGRTMATVVGR